mmetsp:Transcript_28/g.115  ORF Transcript_28/g.115 Transcript_28/m.115 type:complete len:166 (-) Transcript_28:2004-2501(-)
MNVDHTAHPADCAGHCTGSLESYTTCATGGAVCGGAGEPRPTARAAAPSSAALEGCCRSWAQAARAADMWGWDLAAFGESGSLCPGFARRCFGDRVDEPVSSGALFGEAGPTCMPFGEVGPKLWLDCMLFGEAGPTCRTCACFPTTFSPPHKKLAEGSCVATTVS